MLNILKKFFDFCTAEDRKKFYQSIYLGIIKSFIIALRIPAIGLVLMGLIEKNLSMQTFWLALGIMLVSTVLNVWITLKITMLQTEAGYHTCAQKRIEIAEHMRYLPMGYFNQNSLGKITSVTTNTLEGLSDVATRVVMMTVQGFLTTGLITILVFLYDWRVGLVLLVGLILFLLPNTLMRWQVGKVSDDKYQADTDLVAVVLEYSQGIAEVKNYNLVNRSAKKLSKAIEGKSQLDTKMTLVTSPYIALQGIVTKLTGLFMGLFSIYFYLNGSMELLVTIMMIVSGFMIYENLDGVGSFSSLLRIVDLSVDMVNQVLAIQPMDISGQDIEPKSSQIELRDVGFSYGNKKIIDQVSLTIPEKTTTALVGPSGSGKTTLCYLIARFWDVDQGSISLDGHDVRDYSYDSLIRNFSFVFQSVYLFEDTIANNIRFGKPEASQEEVIEAAKKAACHDFILSLPDGYDTKIGEGGASLSGGERQRISIARAIIKDAPIIILDEATANVDPENEEALMQAIRALTRDKTIIMIAHRLKTVEHADQILVLDQGRIVEQGKHQDLLAKQGIYSKFIQERKTATSWRIDTES
ncbi:ABC transporter, ATP-binding protein [Streptococcus sp. oral taxon 071 str. 73H25AP]|uniref:Multidrug ABC transporter ATP-binding protein n=1 Tax=Streptococcus oralis subsp. tigurinus TaxID=1077464 RepID=A0A1X1GP08_STROR|nr:MULTISPECIES: ABC transporter ATP-binding protein [Streptococcus]EFM36125.1 ABC transporter, ATP-binding protein [Streptococcus sp. oral taxon 071 str. 73H25AP]MCY7064518.1 ABC transporter ATP-binding protein/permease [Streptococcus oralis]MCY7077352.1 ABC transporter ATP-binding protein/permease [Streptococcus oralis]ORO48435.1 multidrug ABC transporter ATP-binding protein [Streptococcus oralis subsp. tigurinus]UJD01529.1 ATP-binding cassette domain-containing protein [Streptococcus oralis